MTDRPILFSDPMVRALLEGRKTQTRRVLKPTLEGFQSPLYRRGDRLWVRECFGIETPSGLVGIVKVKYRATNGLAMPPFSGWKPSIHMARTHSRTTLIVTDVRVQRLQDISADDAVSEGCELKRWKTGDYPFFDPGHEADNRALVSSFRRLWDGLNAERGFGWGANPWVCALTFTVHRCNIDEMGADA